jgi:beta-lactamase class A
LDSEIETAVRDVQLGNLGSRPLRNVVHMMIVASGNRATNMVIERFYGRAVNAGGE